MKTILWTLAACAVALTVWASPQGPAGDDGEPEAPALTDAQVAQKLETVIRLVDFQEASLREILDFLERELGVTIVFADGVEKVVENAKITIRLMNVPAKDLLRFILTHKGLTYRIKDGEVRIVKPDEKEQEEEQGQE